MTIETNLQAASTYLTDADARQTKFVDDINAIPPELPTADKVSQTNSLAATYLADIQALDDTFVAAVSSSAPPAQMRLQR